ncbi:MAG: O-antigen ligase family protein [bacterium]
MNRTDSLLVKTGDLVIVALLIVVPLLVDMNTLYPTGPATKNLVLAWGAALALFFVSIRLIVFGRSITLSPAQIALVLFGLYLLIRAVCDVRPDYALGVATPHLGCVAIALMLSILHQDRRNLRPHFATLTVCTVIAVVYAVSQIFDYDLLFRLVYGREGTWYNPVFEEERAVVFSTFGNPNYFAHFLGPLILLGLVPAFSSRRRVVRGMWWLGLFVSLAVVFRTYNRGIWLGLLTGGAVWTFALLLRYAASRKGVDLFALLVRPKVIFIALLLLSIATVALLWLPMFEPLVRRFRAAFLLRDTSVRSRLLFWFVSLLMWRAHPWIGIGMDRYDPRFFDELLQLAQGPHGETLRNLTQKMVSLRAVYAHNDYAQILAEWGGVGLGLFLLVAVLVLSAAVRAVLRDLHSVRRIALPSVGLLAAFGSFLVQLLYDFPIHLPSSELLFFFIIGAILVFENESGSRAATWRLSNRVVCVVCGLALLAGWAWSLPRLPARLSASHHLYHGQNNARAKNIHIADREYEIAARLDPENGEICYCRAQNLAARDETIRQAIDQYPRSLETYQTSAYHYHLGIAYLAENNYSRAMQSLRRLLDIHPHLKGANYAMGLCYYRNPYGADYSRAAEYFAREAEEYGGDLWTWLYLGDCKMSLHDLHGARDAFRRARDIHDRNVTANERLGDIYASPGDFFNPNVALEYYKMAMEVAAENLDQRKVAEIQNKIEAAERGQCTQR